MTPPAAVPPLGEELVPPGEAEAIRVVADVCLELMDVGASPVPRQQHGKGHGCVRAVFRVAPDVRPELRHGVLATPAAFDAIIRFSNGRQTDDRNKDAHGMAMKLFGVAGPKVMFDERDARTQDFIFMDHETFFIRDAATYAEFAVALRDGTRRSRSRWAQLLPARLRPLIVAVHLFRRFFMKHNAERGFIQKVRSAPPISPLDTNYWSVTPSRLGPHAVRWSVVPRPLAEPIHSTSDTSPSDTDDALRLAMARHLRVHAAEFDVFVQPQTDPVRMPVEDPTVAWDRLAAPLYHVATIEVPVQEFDTPHKRVAGDALSFTNWHSLPEHRPLGGISRVRRAVYHAVASRRRELNGQVNCEPGDDWLDDVWDGTTARVSDPSQLLAAPS